MVRAIWNRRSQARLLLFAWALSLAAACAPPAAPAPTAAPPVPPPTVAAAEPTKPVPAPAAPAKVAAKPTTASELAVYQGADRQQVLEEGARKESTMTWYTSLAGPIVDRLLDGYKQRYPFMNTEVFRGAQNELLTKATQEAQAGQPSFDVLESQISAIKVLVEAKLVTPYYSPTLAMVPDSFKTTAGQNLVESATVRISYISFGYNTTLVPASAVPKALEDLLSPSLAGKLALTGTDTGKRWLGTVLQTMGEEKGKQFLTQLAEQQKPSVQQVSGKAVLDLIAKGEFPASPTIFRDHVDQMLVDSPDAPVKWVALEPATGNPGQGAFAAKGPHPHAGLLYLDFLFSEDGQKIFHDNGYTTASEPVPFKFWIPEAGKMGEQIEQDVKLWDNLFKVMFRS